MQWGPPRTGDRLTFRIILLIDGDGGKECMFACLSDLCGPMDCSPQDSFFYRISQARLLEWLAISSSRGSCWPRDRTHVSCIVGGFFTTEPRRKLRGKEYTNTNQSFQHMIVYVSGQIFPNNPRSLRSRHVDTRRKAHSSWGTFRKCILLGFQQLKSSLWTNNEKQRFFNMPLRHYLRLRIRIILKELMCLWPRFLLYPQSNFDKGEFIICDFGSLSKISFRVTGYSQ